MTDATTDLSELDAALRGLPPSDASPERAALIRARCLAVLQGRRRLSLPRTPALLPPGRRLELLAALLLGAGFLAEVAARTLAVYRA